MGLTAFLCIAIGVYPQPLYALLPFPVDYVPYTTTHVVTMLQLLLFSGLAFAVLQRTGLYPAELRSTVLDFDWVYRKFLPMVARTFMHIFSPLDRFLRDMFKGWINIIIQGVQRQNSPNGLLAHTEHAGHMAQWVVVLLAVYLVLNFL